MNWRERARNIKVGDEVRISESWQKACDIQSAFIPLATGTILRFEESKSGPIAVVEWDLDDVPKRIHVSNLTKIEQIQR